MSITTAERKRFTTGAAVLLVGMFGLFAATTGAFQTDQKTITDNEFQSGAINLDVGITTMAFPHPTEPMSPGDELYAPITVRNTGTIPLRWSMSSLTTEDVLADALQLRIDSAPNAVPGDCTAETYFVNGAFGPGSSIQWNPADEMGISLGSTAPGGYPVIGLSTPGQDFDDQQLGPVGSGTDTMVLCVRVSYPTDAPAAADGLTTDATFIFNAESIAR